jgi:cell division protein FtsL
MNNLKLLKEKYGTLSKAGKAFVWVAITLVLLVVIGGCK